MAIKGFSRQPSPYPRPIFHTIRVTQLISSITVMSVMIYFIYWLKRDHYYIPWTFILLLAVSSFTNISIFVTAFFYFLRTLKPGLSAYINSFLSLLWMLGFSLLSWNINPMLSGQCDIAGWNTSTGVMICHLYKTLEAFTTFGLISTGAALGLDLYCLRQSTRLGRYNAMGNQALRGQKTALAQNEWNDDFSHEIGVTGQDFREPSLEIPEFSHEIKRPYKAQRPIEVHSFGYQAPPEQTAYDSPSVEHDDHRYN